MDYAPRIDHCVFDAAISWLDKHEKSYYFVQEKASRVHWHGVFKLTKNEVTSLRDYMRQRLPEGAKSHFMACPRAYDVNGALNYLAKGEKRGEIPTTVRKTYDIPLEEHHQAYWDHKEKPSSNPAPKPKVGSKRKSVFAYCLEYCDGRFDSRYSARAGKRRCMSIAQAYRIMDTHYSTDPRLARTGVRESVVEDLYLRYGPDELPEQEFHLIQRRILNRYH